MAVRVQLHTTGVCVRAAGPPQTIRCWGHRPTKCGAVADVWSKQRFVCTIQRAEDSCMHRIKSSHEKEVDYIQKSGTVIIVNLWTEQGSTIDFVSVCILISNVLASFPNHKARNLYFEILPYSNGWNNINRMKIVIYLVL